MALRASASSSTSTSTVPMRSWRSIGPRSAGLNFSPVADCTSGGPDSPRVEVRVAMITSEQPAMLAWPANDGPDSSVIMGTSPDSRGNCTKVVTMPPG